MEKPKHPNREQTTAMAAFCCGIRHTWRRHDGQVNNRTADVASKRQPFIFSPLRRRRTPERWGSGWSLPLRWTSSFCPRRGQRARRRRPRRRWTERRTSRWIPAKVKVYWCNKVSSKRWVSVTLFYVFFFFQKASAIQLLLDTWCFSFSYIRRFGSFRKRVLRVLVFVTLILF